MKVISSSELRANLATKLDEVVADRAPMIVTRKGAEPVVLISAEEFNGWMETIHLMSSPANEKELSESIEQYEAGLAKPRDLIE